MKTKFIEICGELLCSMIQIFLNGLFSLPLWLFWKVPNDLGKILVIMMFLDTLTGFLKGWKGEMTSSEKMKRFGNKLVKYCLFIIASAQMQHMLEIINIPTEFKLDLKIIILYPSINKFTLGSLIFTEFLSILENFGEMGLHYPKFIQKRFEKLKCLDMRKKKK